MKRFRTAGLLWIVMIITLIVVGLVFKDTGLHQLPFFTKVISQEIICFLIVYILNKVWSRQTVHFISPVRLRKQLAVVWPLILILLFFDISVLTIGPAFKGVVVNIITVLLIGLFEEYLSRGVLFTLFLTDLNGRSHGLLRATVFSSLLFSLSHLINLSHQGFGVTLLQLGFAFAFGFLLCGVYYKTGSLIWPILIHAMNDFIGFNTHPTTSLQLSSTVVWVQLTEIVVIFVLALYVFSRHNKITI